MVFHFLAYMESVDINSITSIAVSLFLLPRFPCACQMLEIVSGLYALLLNDLFKFQFIPISVFVALPQCNMLRVSTADMQLLTIKTEIFKLISILNTFSIIVFSFVDLIGEKTMFLFESKLRTSLVFPLLLGERRKETKLKSIHAYMYFLHKALSTQYLCYINQCILQDIRCNM